MYINLIAIKVDITMIDGFEDSNISPQNAMEIDLYAIRP